MTTFRFLTEFKVIPEQPTCLDSFCLQQVHLHFGRDWELIVERVLNVERASILALELIGYSVLVLLLVLNAPGALILALGLSVQRALIGYSALALLRVLNALGALILALGLSVQLALIVHSALALLRVLNAPRALILALGLSVQRALTGYSALVLLRVLNAPGASILALGLSVQRALTGYSGSLLNAQLVLFVELPLPVERALFVQSAWIELPVLVSLLELIVVPTHV